MCKDGEEMSSAAYVGSPSSRHSSGASTSQDANGYSGQWAHLWTDDQRANFPQAMQLPSTRHYDTKELRQDARKTQTDTYVPLLGGFREFVSNFEAWADFDNKASTAKSRWEDYVSSKGGRLPTIFHGISELAFTKLSQDHPIYEADIANIVTFAVEAVVQAFNAMTGSSVKHKANYSVHIKGDASGEAIPYDRKFQMDCACVHHDSVVVYIEIKRPLRPFVNCPPEDDEDKSNMSGSEMAESLNRDFLRLGDNVPSKEAPKWYIASMCQLLTGLLHSSTRVVAFTNHCETVFFSGKLENGKLVVRTSGVYTSDGRHRNGVTSQHGILALLGDLTTQRHSIEDNFAIYSAIKGHKPDDPSRGSGGSGAGSSSQAGTGSSKHYTPPKERSRQKRSKASGAKSTLEQTNGHIGRAPWWDASWELEKPDLIFCMLKQHKGIVYNDGFAGNVRLGVFAGRLLAIKYWSGISRDGLDALIHEVKIMHYIWEYHRELMGSAIPWLVAVRHSPPSYTTLVTEYVGEQLDVEVDKAGCAMVRVGDQAVPSDEVPCLEKAVESCVRKVHESGIAHNDIACRNIRAKKNVHGTEVYWCAWLIDFGSATSCATERNKREDLEAVRHVFQGLT